ncbi:MAG TPA: hypothetical protein DEQ26_07390 [Flavobacteriaceae bacterium]|nr:hypothetical protein [Flavobacteriaceae bacterium]
MEKIYYFVFYTLFVFWEKVSIPKFYSEFKAGLSILLIQIFIYYSIIYSYLIITNKEFNFDLKNPILLIPLSIIFLINIFLTNVSSKWKYYYPKFDNLQNIRKIKYMSITWLFILSVIVMFFILSNKYKSI